MEKKKYEQSYSNFEKIIGEKNITSYRVAMDLGISPMTLSDWKRGLSKPRLDTMARVADYLGVSVMEFID